MKKVVLLSGGLDSTTCLASIRWDTNPWDIIAVNMYYGQRHAKEINSARKVAEYYGVDLIELDLAEIFKQSDCSLLKHSDKEIPESSYAEQLKHTDGKPVSTYVPFRNGLMLSAAASLALSLGADEIYYGAHADDAAGSAYPDCSEEFVKAINTAIWEGTGGAVTVKAPFIMKHKADIVKLGLMLNVPYELTWSCYEGGEKPCGRCATCIDRKKAFQENGVEDPYDKITE